MHESSVWAQGRTDNPEISAGRGARSLQPFQKHALLNDSHQVGTSTFAEEPRALHARIIGLAFRGRPTRGSSLQSGRRRANLRESASGSVGPRTLLTSTWLRHPASTCTAAASLPSAPSVQRPGAGSSGPTSCATAWRRIVVEQALSYGGAGLSRGEIPVCLDSRLQSETPAS